jgi:16S rRNA (cytidine1402-2'-O)-methyltransferase
MRVSNEEFLARRWAGPHNCGGNGKAAICMAEQGKAQGPEAAVADRAAQVIRGLMAAPLAPGLYVVATPIGNLADITLRALSVLARTHVLYCEDTRHSRTLLAHYGISRPTRPYHEHNAERERPRLLAELAAGRSVALISDAGTPLISDPGYKLVREVLAAGHPLVSLPGPSAPLAALASAGLATDAFLFAGFLPPRSKARQTRLGELKAVPATLVFFEAPSRLADSLADIAAVLGTREAAVARELTKLHEEVRRGTPAELAQWAAEAARKGEMVILVGPPVAEAVTDEAILARLEPLLANMSLSDAARAVAQDLGVPRSRAYDLALALQRNDRGSDP